MQYHVNDTVLSYSAEGQKRFGEHKVLLDEAVDLTADTPWHKTGFTIEELFPPTLYSQFSESTHTLLLKLWREAGLKMPDDFQLHDYHRLVVLHDQHLLTIEKTKLLSVEEFPLGIQAIEERISEICSTKLVAQNPYDNQRIFHFRVIRPQSQDNNPLHRDVWLEDYASCINLYIPIAGSNHNSSLILIPGSHLWPESRIERTEEGGIINGVKFNVPAVTDITGEYEVIRPDPLPNEVLVFSPYLIHGGAVNLNTDLTRISIELRLWKA
jgi:hypothetical protein